MLVERWHLISFRTKNAKARFAKGSAKHHRTRWGSLRGQGRLDSALYRASFTVRNHEQTTMPLAMPS